MAGFDGTRPIFLQLAEMLEEGIISGAYPEEGQIPSITEYSAALKINPATALKGINLLVDAGLVFKKRRESFYTERVCPVAHEAASLGLTLAELNGLVERAYNSDEKE